MSNDKKIEEKPVKVIDKKVIDAVKDIKGKALANNTIIQK
jgi:hypothetical protein